MFFLFLAVASFYVRKNIQKQIEIYPEKDPKRIIFWANIRLIVLAILAIANISVNLYFNQNIFSSDFLSPFFE